jgi:hypothetical protein
MGLNTVSNGLSVHDALIRQRNKAKLKRILGIEKLVETLLYYDFHEMIFTSSHFEFFFS